ncbi:MAG: lamin tail domain-containing protein [Candidatus Paceibacterota bacterium]
MVQCSNTQCKYSLLILVALFSFFPIWSFASVSISEVMYDPAGSDDGHEWIEVYNSGASFDLSKWKLFEGGTNHGISAYTGGSTLATGGYAVLVDNPSKFLADWPQFSGQIFDTVFSGGLNNANGEALTLRNDSLVDIDSITYSPTMGAGGDGNSLQKVGSSFTTSSPTPSSAVGGGSTSGTSGNQGTNIETSNSSVASSTPSNSSGSYFIEPKISVSTGGDRTVVASAGTVFEGRVQGLKGEAITNARLVWNFGNGESREGRSVLYAFPYPGRYVVILDASSEIYSATTRLTVTVVPAQVSITEVNSDFVEITNSSNIELNLGLWQLTAGGQIFRFPTNTILFPHESVAISNIATGLAPSSPKAVALLYPNGTLAATYGTELIVARKIAEVVPPYPQESSSNTVPSSNTVRVSSPSSNLLAAPVTALSSTSMPELASFGMLPWIVGLLAVIGIGIGAVLLIRGSKGTTTGYTIIEEE